eukprot:gb/GECH01010061.1/.p1 GENE.gb/GECH01010061.1/~~gb/GECH01010061.1/.p1  ORF type:complete len:1277 (+),score=329.52 gb/GECH01010061.1/:1-3831(+)
MCTALVTLFTSSIFEYISHSILSISHILFIVHYHQSISIVMSSLDHHHHYNHHHSTRNTIIPRWTSPIISEAYLLFSLSRYTWKEIRHRTTGYILGVMACVVVAFVVAIAVTALGEVPRVFLRLAEQQNGATDILLRPDTTVFPAQSLNYSAIAAALHPVGSRNHPSEGSDRSFSRHAPRIQIPGRILSGSQCRRAGVTLTDLREGEGSCGGGSVSGELYLMDWEREMAAGMGEGLPPGPGPGGGTEGKEKGEGEETLPELPYALFTEGLISAVDIDIDTNRSDSGSDDVPNDAILQLDPSSAAVFPFLRAAGFNRSFPLPGPGRWFLPLRHPRTTSSHHSSNTAPITMARHPSIHNPTPTSSSSSSLPLRLSPPLSAGIQGHAPSSVQTAAAASLGPAYLRLLAHAIPDYSVKDFSGSGSADAAARGNAMLAEVRTRLRSRNAEERGWNNNNNDHDDPFNNNDTISSLNTNNTTHNTTTATGVIDIRSYVNRVVLNISPASQRRTAYTHASFDTVQRDVTAFAAAARYRTAVQGVTLDLPVLDFLSDTQLFSLFLALIIAIIVTVLSALAAALIYALLMVSVETRQFEHAVLRMVGASRLVLVRLILVQAIAFSLPAIVIALPAAQLVYIGIARIIQHFLQSSSISNLLSPRAAALAAALAVVIPTLSAIVPVRAAVQRSVRDGLDTSRPKVAAVEYKIDRSEENGGGGGKWVWGGVVLGLAMAVIGFGTYYIFPLALLSFNLALLLGMFFVLLIAMLLGLVLLASNALTILLTSLGRIFTFFEHGALRSLLVHNIVAHTRRNRKTAIMLAVSLGFVIFISVSFRLQATAFVYQEQQQHGTRIRVEGSNLEESFLFRSSNPRWALDQFLHRQSVIDSYAFMSRPLHEEIPRTSYPRLANPGRFAGFQQRIRAISPGFFHTTGTRFLRVESTASPLSTWSLSQQLYAARSSGRLLFGALYADELRANEDTVLLVRATERAAESGSSPARQSGGGGFQPGGGGGDGDGDGGQPSIGGVLGSSSGSAPIAQHHQYLLRALGFLSAAPGMTLSQFPAVMRQDSPAALPTVHRMIRQARRGDGNGNAGGSVLDVPLSTVLLSFRDGATEQDINTFKSTFSSELGSVLTLSDVESSLEPISIATQVMDFFFAFTTAVAMAVCFFSLVSSMYSNIYEQSKEIGVLRAIGTRRFLLWRLYVWEAFTVVMGAAGLGMVIGTVLAYTMLLQRVLFTQLPIPFAFPWPIVLVVLVLAVLFAFAAALGPVMRLTRMPIVAVLKRVLA